MFYGTEVFELNQNLRDIAVGYAEKVSLQKSDSVTEHCTHYGKPAASSPPAILTTDVASSNVFFHGSLLSESVQNTFSLFTKNRAVYGLTAQEE